MDVQQAAAEKIQVLQAELEALPDQLKGVQANRKTQVDALMKEAGILDQVLDLDAQMEAIFKQLQGHADRLQGQIAAWTEVQTFATEVAEAEELGDSEELGDFPEEPEDTEDPEDPEPHFVHGIDVTKLNDHTKYQVMGGNQETIAALKATKNPEPEEPESDLLDDMEEVDALLEGVRTAEEDEEEEPEDEEFEVEDFLGEEDDGKETPVESLVQRYRTEGA